MSHADAPGMQGSITWAFKKQTKNQFRASKQKREHQHGKSHISQNLQVLSTKKVI